jgi:hypothetical protein
MTIPIGNGKFVVLPVFIDPVVDPQISRASQETHFIETTLHL